MGLMPSLDTLKLELDWQKTTFANATQRAADTWRRRICDAIIAPTCIEQDRSTGIAN